MSATRLFLGDCLDALRQLPDASVDAVVTDPPYGLSFMGKRWDYDVPTVEVWAECLRVLKPGGHLLAFAGTRTQHRMAVRIEDAGFEIRDMIAWVYGSGFPKSLDVSKAIDRMDASEEQERRRLRFTAWVRSTGATSRQIDAATETNMGGHYTTLASQPAIMTREHLEACRHLLGDIPDWVEREVDIRSVESQNMADREVVGQQGGSLLAVAPGQDNDRSATTLDITAPATDAARQWAGWGTALKPALEPITVARKPLSGTVAATVLEHGTGALNVDGCRVEGVPPSVPQPLFNSPTGKIYGMKAGEGRNGEMSHASGRWPANLIHDGSEDATGLLGEAARFFYSPKADGTDRNEGLEDMEARLSMRYGEQGQGPSAQQTPRKPVAQRNIHPTVKPTDLMQYLCRLVTPPGGTVLDPFMGSGSTGKAAQMEGFRFIGCERDPDYFAIAKARIETAHGSLFANIADVEVNAA
jgi:DNA modification methylase